MDSESFTGANDDKTNILSYAFMAGVSTHFFDGVIFETGL